MSADASTDRTLEREANVFGAELLMPQPAVREVTGVSARLVRDPLVSLTPFPCGKPFTRRNFRDVVDRDDR